MIQILESLIFLPFYLLVYSFRIFSLFPHRPLNPQVQNLYLNLQAQLAHPCAFRLDTTSSAQITLQGNPSRKLGYASYGDLSSKKTIIKLHGLPGSRLEESWHEETAKALGLRIIGVDRPGVGLSSPDPDFTLNSFAKDIENLADALRLETFAVMGTSGGGPYAMACARYLPAHRLRAVGIVTGMGDIQRFFSKGMGWRNWLGYKYAIHWIPWIFAYDASKWPINRTDLSEEDRLRLSIEELAESSPPQMDVQAWNSGRCGVDFIRLSLRAGREYFLNGYETLLQDAKIIGSA